MWQWLEVRGNQIQSSGSSLCVWWGGKCGGGDGVAGILIRGLAWKELCQEDHVSICQRKPWSETSEWGAYASFALIALKWNLLVFTRTWSCCFSGEGNKTLRVLAQVTSSFVCFIFSCLRLGFLKLFCSPEGPVVFSLFVSSCVRLL